MSDTGLLWDPIGESAGVAVVVNFAGLAERHGVLGDRRLLG